MRITHRDNNDDGNALIGLIIAFALEAVIALTLYGGYLAVCLLLK